MHVDWRLKASLAVVAVATAAAFGQTPSPVSAKEIIERDSVTVTGDGSVRVIVSPGTARAPYYPLALVSSGLRAGTEVIVDFDVLDAGGATLFALYGRAPSGTDEILAYFPSSSRESVLLPAGTRALVIKALNSGTTESLRLRAVFTPLESALIKVGETRAGRQAGSFRRYSPLAVVSFPVRGGAVLDYVVTVRGDRGRYGLYARPVGSEQDLLLAVVIGRGTGRVTLPGEARGLVVKPLDGDTPARADVTLAAELIATADDRSRLPVTATQRDSGQGFAAFAPFNVVDRVTERGETVTYAVDVVDDGGAQRFGLYGRTPGEGADTLVAVFSQTSDGSFVARQPFSGYSVKVVEGRADGGLDLTLVVGGKDR